MELEELIRNLAVQWFHQNDCDEAHLHTMFDIVRGAYQEAQTEGGEA